MSKTPNKPKAPAPSKAQTQRVMVVNPKGKAPDAGCGRVTPRDTLTLALEAEHDECIVWPHATRRGYPKASVKGKTVGVHAYICEREHGPRPSKQHFAGHRCGQSLCINRRHVRWVTKRQNERDKRTHGTAPRGERNPFARCTAEVVIEVRKRYRKGGATCASLAAEFGVSASTISKIVRKQTWRHIKETNPTRITTEEPS
ncbi:MAG: HNH endonuclease [Porticoccaceae bacterium]